MHSDRFEVKTDLKTDHLGHQTDHYNKMIKKIINDYFFHNY